MFLDFKNFVNVDKKHEDLGSLRLPSFQIFYGWDGDGSVDLGLLFAKSVRGRSRDSERKLECIDVAHRDLGLRCDPQSFFKGGLFLL